MLPSSSFLRRLCALRRAAWARFTGRRNEYSHGEFGVPKITYGILEINFRPREQSSSRNYWLIIEKSQKTVKLLLIIEKSQTKDPNYF